MFPLTTGKYLRSNGVILKKIKSVKNMYFYIASKCSPADDIVYVIAVKVPLVIHKEFDEQHKHHHPSVNGQQANS